MFSRSISYIWVASPVGKDWLKAGVVALSRFYFKPRWRLRWSTFGWKAFDQTVAWHLSRGLNVWFSWGMFEGVAERLGLGVICSVSEPFHGGWAHLWGFYSLCLVGPRFVNARLVVDGPSHRRTCISGYTDLEKATGPVEGFRALEVLFSQVPYFCYESLQWEEDVDYLPMAKPVSQITTRGSAVTVACLSGAVGRW